MSITLGKQLEDAHVAKLLEMTRFARQLRRHGPKINAVSYPFPQSQFRAFCTNVFNADTVELLVDLGFRVQLKVLVKLAGIKAPQLDAKSELEREEAERARGHLADWLMPLPFKNVVDLNRWPLSVYIRQGDDHGQWAGSIWVCDKDGAEFSVAPKLIEMGLGIATRI